MKRYWAVVALVAAASVACSGGTTPSTPRPSILLITLDNTRADSIGGLP